METSCSSTDVNGMPEWFPLFFIGFWLFISFGISRLGWHALAQKYGWEGYYPDGIRWFGWRRGDFGTSGPYYNSCLWIGFHREGVFLKTGPLFLYRFGHPPVRIPWTDFKEVVWRRFLFWEWGTLSLKHSPWLRLSIPKKAAKLIETARGEVS